VWRVLRPFRRVRNLSTLLGPLQTLGFVARWCLRRKVISVRVRDVPTTMLLRRADSDVLVLWQAFGMRECDIDLPTEPRFIVDGGAYVGYTSVFFANKYPGARVVAVEPSNSNGALLRVNTRDFPNIHVLPMGLWSEPAHLKIVNPEALSWGFRFATVPPGTPGAVEAISIPALMARFGADRIDILKLDIEGAEEALFSSGCEQWLDKVGAIIVEVHGAPCERAVHDAVASRPFDASRQGEKIVLIRTGAPAPPPAPQIVTRGGHPLQTQPR
jgi:FkbM family methyltransferase